MTARYDPDRHHRRSIRLKGYDYTLNGAYFVTIVAQHRLCLFADVDGNDMRLNDAGRMIATQWRALHTRFPTIQLDAFVVMPNHIHGIIVVTCADTPKTGATTRVAPTSLGVVVGAYKSSTTVEFTRGVKTLGWPSFVGKLWQRNYYEHIIRHDAGLNRIRQYIAENPTRWAEDPENPFRLPAESSVGAPLVGAQTQPKRGVRAPLVGAQTHPDRATTRVAPTGDGDDEADT